MRSLQEAVWLRDVSNWAKKDAYVSAQIPDGGSNNPLNQIFQGLINAEEIHLLSDSANKYLYSYAAWGESCLDPGAQAKTYEYTAPVVIETDEWGVTSRSGGEHYEATYTLNPDFFGLRDRIATYGGARDSDDPFNRPAKAQVYLGIVEMKRQFGCRSDEVKTFERQLRELTTRVLDDPGTVPPSAENQPPRPEKVVAAAFPPVPEATAAVANRVAVNSPLALPAPAATRSIATTQPASSQRNASAATGQGAEVPAGAQPGVPQRAGAGQPAARAAARQGTGATPPDQAGSADIAGMSAIEKQQAMTAEMNALQQQVQQEMAALNERVQASFQNGANGEERTRIMAEYQAGIAELQQRMQQQVQAVQEKYR